jgi:PAS domain S-box-containing protein
VNPINSAVADKLRTAAFSYSRWREKFLRIVLYGALAITLAALVKISGELPHQGLAWMRPVYLIGWLCLALCTFAPLRYWMRAGAFVLLLYGMGLNALLFNGLYGDGRMYFLLFVVMLTLLFHPRWGIAGQILCLVTILGLGGLVLGAKFRLFDPAIPPGDFQLWIISALIYLLQGGVVITGLNLFLRELEAAQERTRQVLSDLAQERTLLRTLIDHLPVSVFAKDVQGRKTLTNPVDLRYMKVQNDAAVLGKTDLEIFPSDVAASMFADDLRVLQSGYPVIDRQEYFYENDQKKRWLLTSKIPLRNEQGQITGLVGISYDITDRLEAEAKIHQLNAELEQRVLDRTAQLEAANSEMEAFTYSVSHDLRAPLRTIAGYIDVVMDDYTGQLDSTAIHYLNRIKAGAMKMNVLIDDLLKFSRIGRQPVHKEKVDLAGLARQVYAELAEAQARQRQVEFVLGDLPVLDGDYALLQQVFANLLGNAIKYSRNNAQARIEVGCEHQDGKAVIFVRDNGAGFDMRYASKLFGVFQRLHPESEFEGTGVGLAIVQRIIAKHGGQVWASAEVGQGATFYFSLPHN